MKSVKKKRNFRNMAVISIVLFTSLNSVGIGYGNWASTVKVENTMETGDVNASFKDSSLYIGSSNTVTDDGNTINLVMEACAEKTSTGNFEIINEGTLPIAINYNTFNPVVQDCIAGLPIAISLNIDFPVSSVIDPHVGTEYIKPGESGCGQVTIEVTGDSKESTDEIVESDGASNNTSTAEFNETTKIVKESKTFPFTIPIGHGVWEENLNLNVTVNISRTIKCILPDVTGETSDSTLNGGTGIENSDQENYAGEKQDNTNLTDVNMEGSTGIIPSDNTTEQDIIDNSQNSETQDTTNKDISDTGNNIKAPDDAANENPLENGQSPDTQDSSNENSSDMNNNEKTTDGVPGQNALENGVGYHMQNAKDENGNDKGNNVEISNGIPYQNILEKGPDYNMQNVKNESSGETGANKQYLNYGEKYKHKGMS